MRYIASVSLMQAKMYKQRRNHIADAFLNCKLVNKTKNQFAELQPKALQNKMATKTEQLDAELRQQFEQQEYKFDNSKLQLPPSSALHKKQIVLLACGSFNPPTVMHVRIFGMCLWCYDY
mgnify:CR=1 FL=1